MVASRRFSTLDDWLVWLETLHPKKIDFSLNRIRAVLEALDLTTPSYRVITVGGTNGKGSCVAILESIYRAAGHAVGAFTSPHLWRFNERLRVDGEDVGDAALMELFEAMDAARGQVTLSYFEASAVAAMLYFAWRRVDVAILEVGMGGRLDAVNVLDADVAVIVSIDMDHEEWLGRDRDAIGREKAGIMRAGRPVVIADPEPPASVLAAVDATGALARIVGRDFEVEPDGEGMRYRAAPGAAERLPRPPFGGEVQLLNAAACVTVVDALKAVLPVERAALAAGIRQARVAGRMERFEIEGVEWVFDVAHNPAAAKRFKQALGAPGAGRTLAVFGAMGDKDLAGVLGHFVAEVGHWLLTPVESERGASAATLGAVLAALDSGPVTAYANVAAACAAARAEARRGDRVLVFGSFYTVGPAMAALGIYSPALSKG